MQRWMLCGILFVIAVCQGRESDTPAQPLSVLEASTRIVAGMNTNDVAGLMGKPWRDHTAKTTITGPGCLFPTVTLIQRFEWHEGNNVAVVDLTDGYVTSVHLRRFLIWGLLGFNDYGGNMREVERRIGPPNRSAERVVAGKTETIWVYTDKIGMERTLALTFNEQGQRDSAMLSPYYPGYDDMARF